MKTFQKEIASLDLAEQWAEVLGCDVSLLGPVTNNI